jgi:hypothetical protein
VLNSLFTAGTVQMSLVTISLTGTVSGPTTLIVTVQTEDTFSFPVTAVAAVTIEIFSQLTHTVATVPVVENEVSVVVTLSAIGGSGNYEHEVVSTTLFTVIDAQSQLAKVSLTVGQSPQTLTVTVQTKDTQTDVTVTSEVFITVLGRPDLPAHTLTATILGDVNVIAASLSPIGGSGNYSVSGVHSQFTINATTGVVEVTVAQSLVLTHDIVLTLADLAYSSDALKRTITLKLEVPDRDRMLIIGGDIDGIRDNVRWSTNGSVWLSSNVLTDNKARPAALSSGGTVFVIGGWTNTRNSGWLDYFSGDNDWIQQATQYDETDPVTRHGHEGWVLNGTMYIAGGEDSSDANVAFSTDGLTWTILTAAADGVSGSSSAVSLSFLERENYGAATHNGTMFLFGGNASTGSAAVYEDMWASTNGAVWRQIATSIPAGTGANSQLVSHNGLLYLIGGSSSDIDEANDMVWSSSDGVSWTESPAMVDSLYAHSALSFNGTLYAMGRDSNTVARVNAMAADGSWIRVTAVAGYELSDVAFGNEAVYLLNEQEATLTSPSAVTVANSLFIVPLSGEVVLTLSVSGGRGGPYVQTGATVQSLIGSEGVLTIAVTPSALTQTLMLTIADANHANTETTVEVNLLPLVSLISDNGIMISLEGLNNVAILTLTLGGGGGGPYSVSGEHPQFDIGSDGVISVVMMQTGSETHSIVLTLVDNNFVTSPATVTLILNPQQLAVLNANDLLVAVEANILGETEGLFVTVSVIGGSGDYAISEDSSLFGVDNNGVMSLTALVTITGTHTAVLTVQDTKIPGDIIVSVFFEIPDEVRMILVGSDISESQRDVRWSTNGSIWIKQDEALDTGESAARDGAGFVLNDTLFIASYLDDVGKYQYSSDSGVSWTSGSLPGALDTSSGFEAEVINNVAYLFGSTSNDSGVYRSTNGTDWTKLTVSGITDAAFDRQYHAVAVHNGSIYMIGGVDSGNRNVWRSSDGINWVQVATSLPSGTGINMDVVSYADSLYLIGGDDSDHENETSQVWVSNDGASWSSYSALPSDITSPHGYVRGGSLYVVGTDGSTNSGHVFVLEANDEWRELTISSVPSGTDDLGDLGDLGIPIIYDPYVTKSGPLFSSTPPVNLESSNIVTAHILGEEDGAAFTLELSGGSTRGNYRVLGSHSQFAMSGVVISVTALQTITTTHTLVLTLQDAGHPDTVLDSIVTVTVDVPDRARMLLHGGAKSSGRNRWSANGKVWVERHLAFSGMRAGVGFHHEGSVILVGGLVEGSSDAYINSIARSPDSFGTNWIQTPDTAVASRAGMKGAILNGTLYFSGGELNSDNNNIKSSTDGVNWTTLTVEAYEQGATTPTTGINQDFLERGYHAMVEHNNTLFIIGGDQNQDVWSSTNGTVWNQVTTALPAETGYYPAVASHNGFLYMMAGDPSSNSGASNKAWRSDDGAEWEELGDLGTDGVRWASAFSLAGSLYVVAAISESSRGIVFVLNEDGTTWRELTSTAFNLETGVATFNKIGLDMIPVLYDPY